MDKPTDRSKNLPRFNIQISRELKDKLDRWLPYGFRKEVGTRLLIQLVKDLEEGTQETLICVLQKGFSFRNVRSQPDQDTLSQPEERRETSSDPEDSSISQDDEG